MMKFYKWERNGLNGITEGICKVNETLSEEECVIFEKKYIEANNLVSLVEISEEEYNIFDTEYEQYPACIIIYANGNVLENGRMKAIDEYNEKYIRCIGFKGGIYYGIKVKSESSISCMGFEDIARLGQVIEHNNLVWNPEEKLWERGVMNTTDLRYVTIQDNNMIIEKVDIFKMEIRNEEHFNNMLDMINPVFVEKNREEIEKHRKRLFGKK